ncbi:hypothetical protein [Pseudomarimonas arenosa]|uniref:Lipoprotein n=1 Tax=Pseudomarimonas arenosa TaxID=2774145 RepID=A0AAW3ZHC2_9GAMM|nr:hypothetical protein [Pseudomarimonas arenosa]MBD8525418.1 hypothetical protein [Pseudomarimonas arenosa]
MQIRRSWLIVLLPLMLLLMGARQAPLNDPDPIMIPQGLSGEQVVKEIKRALIGRNWTITNEQQGRIDSTLNLRDHVARIAVSYDAERISVAYVSSENLKFEEKKGERYIHKNYMSWVNNVVVDLNRGLQLQALD